MVGPTSARGGPSRCFQVSTTLKLVPPRTSPVTESRASSLYSPRVPPIATMTFGWAGSNEASREADTSPPNGGSTTKASSSNTTPPRTATQTRAHDPRYCSAASVRSTPGGSVTVTRSMEEPKPASSPPGASARPQIGAASVVRSVACPSVAGLRTSMRPSS